MATETENTERKFMARWVRDFEEQRYFRFNVAQGLQDIGLEEHRKKGMISAATYGYLTHPAQKVHMRALVQNMKHKESVYREDFA
jgi:hypothetical protein